MGLLRKVSYSIYASKGVFALNLTAFVLVSLASLGSGVVQLFPIFTVPLSQNLHYSQTMVNRVVVGMSMGNYLAVPFVGYLADNFGAGSACLLSIIAYVPGFLSASYVYKYDLSYIWMVVSFFFIGIGSSCSILFSLVISAKAFNTYYKSLSIGMPNVMIGVSSVVLLQVVKTFVLKTDQLEEGNFLQVFYFFSWVLTLAGCLAYVAASFADAADEYDSDFSGRHARFNSEMSPLLAEGAIIYNGERMFDTLRRQASVESLHLSTEPLLESCISSNSQVYHKRLKSFLTDNLAYALVLAFLITVGSSDLYSNNLGSILGSLKSGNLTSQQISLHAASSTVSRIAVMLSSDFLANSPSPSLSRLGTPWEYFWKRFPLRPVSRLTTISLVTLAGSFAHFALARASVGPQNMWTISITNGAVNGAIYTIYPTLVAYVWGIDILGTTWGLFSVTPTLSNFVFNVIFALDYSQHCSALPDAPQKLCNSTTFVVTGACLLFSSLSLMVLKGKYLKRAGEFF